MKIEKIMVIGAGQMGSGIAQVCAQAGFRVILNDIKPEFIERGEVTIQKNLASQTSKGRMTTEQRNKLYQGLLFQRSFRCVRGRLRH